jgi:hypothetical protein
VDISARDGWGLILKPQIRNLEIGIEMKSLGVMNGVVVLFFQNELIAFLAFFWGTTAIHYLCFIYAVSI